MIDAVLDFISEVIKAIVQIIIISLILYSIGYFVLWVFTLGKYPKGLRSKHREDIIPGVGFLFVIFVWCGIAVYNNFIRMA